MFIHCFDESLKDALIKAGYKLLYERGGRATFVFDKNIKFNFNEVDKSKVLVNNKMTF